MASTLAAVPVLKIRGRELPFEICAEDGESK